MTEFASFPSHHDMDEPARLAAANENMVRLYFDTVEELSRSELSDLARNSGGQEGISTGDSPAYFIECHRGQVEDAAFAIELAGHLPLMVGRRRINVDDLPEGKPLKLKRVPKKDLNIKLP